MMPKYKPGGDAYDIVRDPDLVTDKWKCPRCKRSWQNQRYQSKQNRPADSRCPNCGGRLVNYWDYQHKLTQTRSWWLFSIALCIVVFFGLAGGALFHYAGSSLIRDGLLFVLGIVTLRAAFIVKEKRLYNETGCYYHGGEIWPSKAGFLLLLVLGLLFFGLFINEIFHFWAISFN